MANSQRPNTAGTTMFHGREPLYWARIPCGCEAGVEAGTIHLAIKFCPVHEAAEQLRDLGERIADRTCHGAEISGTPLESDLLILLGRIARDQKGGADGG